MTDLIRKTSILGLAAVLFFSAMACCCLTEATAAEPEVPSCHQTATDSNSQQHNEDCQCDRNPATYSAPADFNTPLLVIDSFTINDLSIEENINKTEIIAYQAPPSVHDTSPLYIKHSILRI